MNKVAIENGLAVAAMLVIVVGVIFAVGTALGI